MIKRIKRFCSSDVELRTETCWEGGKEKIDGFYFLSKKPFSNAYQYCGTISLRDTYPILSLISEAIKQKKKVCCSLLEMEWFMRRLLFGKEAYQKQKNLC